MLLLQYSRHANQHFKSSRRWTGCVQLW